MTVEDLRCPECAAELETEDIYWAHLRIHHFPLYTKLEEERKAEKRRRARERMAKISPTLDRIADKFGVNRYLANVFYNTLSGQKRSWEDFKQVELPGVKRIREKLHDIPPHWAYYFYRLATKATGDWQNVNWGDIGESDWRTRYASDEYKNAILKSLERYGITESTAEEEPEAWALEQETEEFAIEQMADVLREYYEEGLDDERLQAIKEGEYVLIIMAKQGDTKAKLALADFTDIPLEKFLPKHELQKQPTRPTKADIEMVKELSKGASTELLKDALIRGKFMGRVIFKDLRTVIANEIESRRTEEMAEEAAEPHPRVIREAVKAMRESMEELARETMESVERKLDAALERMPDAMPRPSVTLEPKEAKPDIHITVPSREYFIDTTLYPFVCPMHLGEENRLLAESMFDKPLHQLTPTERHQVEEKAKMNLEADPEAMVMRNPELELALQQITDPQGRRMFPKNEALYQLCPKHFEECGYSWDLTVTQSVYEFVEEDRILSIPDFERVGIPGQWVRDMIELAQAERWTRMGIPR